MTSSKPSATAKESAPGSSIEALQSRTSTIRRPSGCDATRRLPPTTVAALGLPPRGRTWAKLADDSHASVPLFRAVILWDDQEVSVTVMAMGSRPLLGTELLQGFNLSADFEEDGELTLTAL